MIQPYDLHRCSSNHGPTGAAGTLARGAAGCLVKSANLLVFLLARPRDSRSSSALLGHFGGTRSEACVGGCWDGDATAISFNQDGAELRELLLWVVYNAWGDFIVAAANHPNKRRALHDAYALRR